MTSKDFTRRDFRRTSSAAGAGRVIGVHIPVLQGGTEGPVTTDDHQGVHVVGFQGLAHGLEAVAVHVRVEPGGAEDGPAAGQDAPHVVAVQWPGAALHEPLPAVEDSDHLGIVLLYRPDHGRPDDGVQSRAVSACGEDADNIHDQ